MLTVFRFLIFFSVPTFVGLLASYFNLYPKTSFLYWLVVLLYFIVCILWGYSQGMRCVETYDKRRNKTI